MLLVASVTGFGAALVVHVAVGYVDFFHLAQVYVGIVWVGWVLWLSGGWFGIGKPREGAGSSTA